MKMSSVAATYSITGNELVKKNFEIEDLGGGWTRLIERGIYFRIRAKDYFLYVKKTTIDERCMVVDCQEGIYKVLDNDFVRKFNRSTDELKEFQDVAKTIWPKVEEQMGSDAYNKLIDFVLDYQSKK